MNNRRITIAASDGSPVVTNPSLMKKTIVAKKDVKSNGETEESPIFVSIQEPQVNTFTVKQENGGQVTYRILQSSGSEETQNRQKTGSALPENLVDSKLLLSPENPSPGPGSLFLSNGVLYVVAGTSATSATPETPPDAIQTDPIATDTKNVLIGSRPRPIAPATSEDILEGKRETGRERENKRRTVHNEVERRRRDKINNWICKLAKVLPDYSDDSQMKGVNLMTSKAGILSKACDYITQLQEENRSLMEQVDRGVHLERQVAALRQELLTARGTSAHQ